MEGTRSFLDDLKIRASWGQTGNANGLGLYPSYTLVSTGGLILNNSYQQIAQLKTIGNTELTWEHSDMFNIGLDARLLNSRLSFTGEYYEKIHIHPLPVSDRHSPCIFPIGNQGSA